MLKVIICDDDEKAVEAAANITKKIFADERSVADISAYTDSRALYFDINDGMSADIAILDIEMPDFSGIEIVKLLKKNSPDCAVIFLTSYVKYAVESFEYDVFRYTPKNMMESKLGEYIASAIKILMKQEGQSLTVHRERSVERIPFKNILSITKEGKYSVVTDIDGHVSRIREPIKTIEDKLPSKEFVMTDRGCILNIVYVRRIERRDAVCIHDFKYPVSQSRIRVLKQAMLDYWGEIL